MPADEATIAIARGARDEINSIPATLQEAQALTSFGDRPLIVVTAGSEQQRGWIEASDQMAKMSTNSAHRVITQATHDSLISGDDASTSSRAILDVVAAVVNGGRLR